MIRLNEHPIQGLMRTAMENLKAMVDVNTIVGDPVTTPDGTTILPISKVGFGFAAGGSEFSLEKEGEQAGTPGRSVTSFESKETSAAALPFGGGSGGGVSITPIAFLVVGTHGVKVVPLEHSTHLVEKLIDAAPQLMEKLSSLFGGDRGKAGTALDQELSELQDVTLGKPMEPIPKSTLS